MNTQTSGPLLDWTPSHDGEILWWGALPVGKIAPSPAGGVNWWFDPGDASGTAETAEAAKTQVISSWESLLKRSGYGYNFTSLDRAGRWFVNHRTHVNYLLDSAEIAVEPSGSDMLHPELWKGFHWKHMLTFGLPFHPMSLPSEYSIP